MNNVEFIPYWSINIDYACGAHEHLVYTSKEEAINALKDAGFHINERWAKIPKYELYRWDRDNGDEARLGKYIKEYNSPIPNYTFK